MSALLRLIPLEKIILYVSLLLSKITAEQWKAALDAVLHASANFSQSADKLAYVKSELLKFKLPTSALNWLVETAVQYAKSKKWIS